MPYSAQQHGSVALSRSQELSSTSYRIETGLNRISLAPRYARRPVGFCGRLKPNAGPAPGRLSQVQEAAGQC